MSRADKGYLVFDIESISDIDLIARVRHPLGEVTPEEALRIFQAEQLEKRGSDFIPFTYQVPVSLVIFRLAPDFSLTEVKVLRWEDGGPKKIAEEFWTYWQNVGCPTFVTFNGRGFDLPLMEMMAFRYGIPLPRWFCSDGFGVPRSRYKTDSHFDLYEFLSNFGATAIAGGLNLVSKVLGKPGKINSHGDMVHEMFEAGRFKEIHEYCFCDVLDTYAVLLRCKLLTGEILPEHEKDLLTELRNYLAARREKTPICGIYLDSWSASENAPTIDSRLARLVPTETD